MLIMGQQVIVQEAKVLPKGEEMRDCFRLRKRSGAVDASYKPKRSGRELPGMKEGVKKRAVSISNKLEEMFGYSDAYFDAPPQTCKILKFSGVLKQEMSQP